MYVHVHANVHDINVRISNSRLAFCNDNEHAHVHARTRTHTHTHQVYTERGSAFKANAIVYDDHCLLVNHSFFLAGPFWLAKIVHFYLLWSQRCPAGAFSLPVSCSSTVSEESRSSHAVYNGIASVLFSWLYVCT